MTLERRVKMCDMEGCRYYLTDVAFLAVERCGRCARSSRKDLYAPKRRQRAKAKDQKAEG